MSLLQTALVITIDTEPDSQWDAEGRRKCSLANIRALRGLQRLFDKYGVRPTYLVCYGVVDSSPSASILKEILAAGRCEIGAHMHPWNTPPITEDELETAAYPHKLPPALQREKIAALTHRIRDVFGVAPTSYRAGRGGFDGESLCILEELGYVVDSSIMPAQSPRFHGCSVWTRMPLEPYFPCYENVCAPGTSSILEVPMTASVVDAWWPRLTSLQRKNVNLTPLDRLLRKVGWASTAWLRPSWSSASEMIKLCETMLKKRAPVLNMMFHSSELIPGASPYVQTTEAADRMMKSIDAVLEYLVGRRHVQAATLTGFANGWIEHTQAELLHEGKLRIPAGD